MILLVDKPAGMTSQQVVSRIKRANTEKLKIGHTGTLDPMCTGLLPVLTGRDTKLNQFLPHRKAYLATIRFGIKTDTGDVTGAVLQTSAIPSEESFRGVLPSMIGPSLQVPPMYSAVHVEGKRLYELARQGIEVVREGRPIEIFDLSYSGRLSDTDYQFYVSCTAGTYIRTLCENIGDAMGLCATMAALRRVESNGFLLDNAYSLEHVTELASQGRLNEISISVQEAFSYLKEIIVPKDGEHYYRNGGGLAKNRLKPVPEKDGLYRAYSESLRFLGLLSFFDGMGKSVFTTEF